MKNYSILKASFLPFIMGAVFTILISFFVYISFGNTEKSFSTSEMVTCKEQIRKADLHLVKALPEKILQLLQ